MKLLFDQNLSFRLCRQLADVFPDSDHVARLGHSEADDLRVCETARAGGFTLVPQDGDFAEMSLLGGPPPKVIWLRCGNQPATFVAGLLRRHAAAIAAFDCNDALACLEMYG